MSSISLHDFEHPDMPGTEPARDRLLKKIKEDAGLPTLGGVISKVLEITSSGEDPVSKLAHFVLADVGLTQKILLLSNTIEYRAIAGTPVTTISRAISLLGFNCVKTSALTMLLVDGLCNKKQVSNVRKELLRSLYASIVARELAQRSKYADAEEAAVAALFKNIGRVLVASFDHQLHERIQRMEANDHAEAHLAVNVLLGCSYERFGETVLQEWQIPETIIQSLSPLPGGELKKPLNRSAWIRQIASFSDSLANMMFSVDENATQANFLARCTTLLPRFGKALEIDKAQLEEILIRVESETRQLADTMNIAIHRVTTRSTDAKTNDKPGSALLTDEFMLKTFDAGLLQQVTRFPSGKPTNARDLLLAGVQEVMQVMTSEQVKLNDIILLVLNKLSTAMGFRFATVCLRDQKLSRYQARFAVGESCTEKQHGFIFPANADQHLFQLAMSNNADLIIADTSIGKIQNMLPQWYKDLLPDARSFIILPLSLHGRSLGFFYADRTHTAEEGVPPDETALIKTLKNQLLAAMMRT